MISLPLSLKELEQTPDMCLCLMYNQSKKGIQVEVRTIKDGELESKPFVITDKMIKEAPKFMDPLDGACATIVKRIRESKAKFHIGQKPRIDL